LSPGDHARKSRPRQSCDSQYLHPDLFFGTIWIQLQERRVTAESRIVDQQTHWWILGSTEFDLFQLIRIRQVGREDFDFYGMVVSQFSGEILQAVTAASNQNQVISIAGKAFGETGTDARMKRR
jgi:hypothetical protein